MIRKARAGDKERILGFCQNTFSWGDYVSYVWDHWIGEGSTLVYEEKAPVGMCHALYSNGQTWIEGIRVHPDHRRRRIASDLVREAEREGGLLGCTDSLMLIDVANGASLSMAEMLGYGVLERWGFYTMRPKKTSADVSYVRELDVGKFRRYVRSWRWIPLDKGIAEGLCSEGKVVRSCAPGDASYAILSDSEHFADVVLVTLFSGSESGTRQVLGHAQNYGFENGKRLQVLTRDWPGPGMLEPRLEFHLMKKRL